MQFDPFIVRQSIENLKVSFPTLIDDEEAWTATLESETSINELLTTIVRRIEDTKALSSGTGERLKELAERKLRFEHRIVAFRELVFKIMQSAELAKVELSEATLSLRAGTQQLVGDVDPDTLPDSFCKIQRHVDRAAIKDALKTGQTVPGFELSNSPPSLTIRIK